jgi:ubiquinol-cytochrome c reductase cytochrome c1 subunit
MMSRMMSNQLKWVLTAAMTLMMVAQPVAAATSDAEPPKQMEWAFDGITGHFDQPSVQRGFQVYKQVCASCHSLKRVHFRNLMAVGFSEAEVKAIAAEYTYKDGPNEEGDMVDRPGRPSDAFPSPFANDNAARASNGGALPPDLSLMVKARHDGANYLHSLLTGYMEPPEGEVVPEGLYYNPYFPGKKIAMPAPLAEGAVEYQDGTIATMEQMSYDVVNFLQWAAEPETEQRKRMGLKVMVFLLLATVFFYIAKRIIWRNVK